jgi:hypothetical protein
MQNLEVAEFLQQTNFKFLSLIPRLSDMVRLVEISIQTCPGEGFVENFASPPFESNFIRYVNICEREEETAEYNR